MEIWIPDEQANKPDLYATGLVSTELYELQSRKKLSQNAAGLTLLPWELRGGPPELPKAGSGHGTAELWGILLAEPWGLGCHAERTSRRHPLFTSSPFPSLQGLQDALPVTLSFIPISLPSCCFRHQIDMAPDFMELMF